jgi:hypothetical protein
MLKRDATFPRQAKLVPEKRLRRRSPQADDNLRLDQFHFRLQPGLARAHFSNPRLLMQPPLPAFLEFEVFNGVGHINLCTLEGRVGESPVEDSAGGSDKRMTLDILFIAGLLAD